MTLGDKRRRFTHCLALLILHTEELGYEAAVDYLKRCQECEVGHERSLHKLGLAVDLNLYKDEHYVTDDTGHKEAHDYWDTLGGAERIDNDMNHYSFAHQGMR